MRSVCWFRNDLRVEDNPALYNACLTSKSVIGIFIVTQSQWKEHDDAKVKINFWFRSLLKLRDSLEKLNIPLVILETKDYENIAETILNFSQDNKVDNLYFNNEYPINELRRDRKVFSKLKEKGIGVFNYHDQVIHAPGTLKTQSDTNFSVYSPFKRKWFAELKDEQLKLLPIPEKKEASDLKSTDITEYISQSDTSNSHYWETGEEFIQEKIKSFLSTKGSKYKEDRNFPGIEATSKLSPYINSGIVSSKWCLVKAMENNNGFLDEGDKGIVHWVSEILWREFYKHIIYNFPKVSMGKPFISNTSNIKWNIDESALNRWKKGETGIPIVDAGMREMNKTGWMHNRLRMITAMFLSKNLLINWQEGEKYFMENLVDGDIASNNGGWQWSASTGTDAAPYFRIMNPETQSLRFDPKGDYIKFWIPELKDCPISEIHMPSEPEKYGYFKPLVDLKISRQKAIEAFQDLKNL